VVILTRLRNQGTDTDRPAIAVSGDDEAEVGGTALEGGDGALALLLFVASGDSFSRLRRSVSP